MLYASMCMFCMGMRVLSSYLLNRSLFPAKVIYVCVRRHTAHRIDINLLRATAQNTGIDFLAKMFIRFGSVTFQCL